MFKNSLEISFKKIFGVKRISFSQPSESKEQDCLFIEIENSRNIIRDGKAIAKVSGNGLLFANADKLPFGFLSKRIAQAIEEDKKNIFFYDLESNTKIYQNIVQRGFSFVYFFSEQYDPEIGTIDEVTINVEET